MVGAGTMNVHLYLEGKAPTLLHIIIACPHVQFSGDLKGVGLTVPMSSVDIGDFDDDGKAGMFYSAAGFNAISPPIRGQIYLKGEASDCDLCRHAACCMQICL